MGIWGISEGSRGGSREFGKSQGFLSGQKQVLSGYYAGSGYYKTTKGVQGCLGCYSDSNFGSTSRKGLFEASRVSMASDAQPGVTLHYPEAPH